MINLSYILDLLFLDYFNLTILMVKFYGANHVISIKVISAVDCTIERSENVWFWADKMSA